VVDRQNGSAHWPGIRDRGDVAEMPINDLLGDDPPIVALTVDRDGKPDALYRFHAGTPEAGLLPAHTAWLIPITHWR
jgi:hypothetical protein